MVTEFKIQIPEGMEIDKENSTFECIKFKPKELTYSDIIKHLSYGYPVFTSNEGHRLKCIILRKLLEIANYLNGDWKPDWNNYNQCKYYISYSSKTRTFFIQNCWYVNPGIVCFSSKENALKAIEIIGEEELKQFYL